MSVKGTSQSIFTTQRHESYTGPFNRLPPNAIYLIFEEFIKGAYFDKNDHRKLDEYRRNNIRTFEDDKRGCNYIYTKVEQLEIKRLKDAEMLSKTHKKFNLALTCVKLCKFYILHFSLPRKLTPYRQNFNEFIYLHANQNPLIGVYELWRHRKSFGNVNLFLEIKIIERTKRIERLKDEICQHEKNILKAEEIDFEFSKVIREEREKIFGAEKNIIHDTWNNSTEIESAKPAMYFKLFDAQVKKLSTELKTSRATDLVSTEKFNIDNKKKIINNLLNVKPYLFNKLIDIFFERMESMDPETLLENFKELTDNQLKECWFFSSLLNEEDFVNLFHEKGIEKVEELLRWPIEQKYFVFDNNVVSFFEQAVKFINEYDEKLAKIRENAEQDIEVRTSKATNPEIIDKSHESSYRQMKILEFTLENRYGIFKPNKSIK